MPFDAPTALMLLAVGLIAGVLAGMLGIGGGLIFTPVLYWLFSGQGLERPELWAIATSLFCTFTASAGGSLRHQLRESIHVREGMYVGLFGAGGTWVGKWISGADWFEGAVFQGLITGLLAYSIWKVVRTILAGSGADAGFYADRRLTKRELGLTGLGGGFIATLAGIGGGLLMVPVLHAGWKQTYRKSVSVSELAIVIISLAGFLQLWAYVDVLRALPLMSGAFLGAFLGVRWHDDLDPRLMKAAHAALMLAALTLIWTS
jgi:uncharacterized membrane protein YfcA